MPTVLGIDVGGPRKGFHAVALDDQNCYESTETGNPKDLAAWCRQFHPQTIGVDSPCRWSLTGRARHAERELMWKGIWCFSTPTREAAVARKDHFGWMLVGEQIYSELHETHPIYDGTTHHQNSVCIETFPHAIVCSLRNAIVGAKNKAAERRSVLTALGIDATRLKNIDFVDAALCAVAAREFTRGAFVACGRPDDGLIVLPSRPI